MERKFSKDALILSLMENKLTTTYKTIYNSAIALVLLTLGAPKFNSLSIIIFAIVIIVGIIKKYIRFQLNWIFTMLIAFYLMYVIGFFFTDNQHVGSKYLEYKMALAILPVLFSFSTKNLFNLKIIFSGLLGCIVLFGGIGFVNAYKCYNETHLSSCFTSSDLSTAIHPSYLAAFVGVLMIALYYGYKEKWWLQRKWILYIATIGLVVYSLFLLSLAGMLFLLILFTLLVVIYFYKKFHWKGVSIAFLILLVTGIFVVKFTPITIKSEFIGPIVIVEEALTHPKDYIESRKYPISGSETRLMMWMMSTELLKEYPFGVGLGDLDDTFEYRFKKQNQLEFAIQHYNPHNQFLQIALELGIPALIFFLIILFLIIKKSIRDRNWLLLLVVSSLIFNCLFESMLQRQYGLIFYVLLICILYERPKEIINNETISSHTM
ncbi:MAG: O-antigen ligase family protein [Crocinitomicaceae bacterium]|nr:O-antigen ligase family protein [Crocinitomicaceae bacterium]